MNQHLKTIWYQRSNRYQIGIMNPLVSRYHRPYIEGRDSDTDTVRTF